MADNFEVLGVVSTVELIGQNQTAPVKLVTARTIPSGFVFSWVNPVAAFNPTEVHSVGTGIAGQLEKFGALPGVVDISMYQDVNAAGQFVNLVSGTVESDSGNSEETVTLATPAGLTDAFSKKVAKARANLNAIEAV